MRAGRFAAVVLSGLLWGCAAELRNPEEFSNVPSCGDVEELLEERCGGAGCHAGENAAASLDLASPGLFARIVDEAGTDNCGGALIVDSSNIGDSLLLDKLGEQPSCGSQMPLGAAALSQDEINCVESYLDEQR